MNVNNSPDTRQFESLNLRDFLAEFLTPATIRLYPEYDLEKCEQEELPF